MRNRRRDHLREKNIAYPTERPKMLLHFLARKEGYAFFDEDDPCAGLRYLYSPSELPSNKLLKTEKPC